MEHVYVPNVPATPVAPYTIVDSETPVLIDVSPSAQNEEIVDVTVTGMPVDETPMILKPSTDNLAKVIYMHDIMELPLRSKYHEDVYWKQPFLISNVLEK